jgi:hypothetical protein
MTALLGGRRRALLAGLAILGLAAGGTFLTANPANATGDPGEGGEHHCELSPDYGLTYHWSDDGPVSDPFHHVVEPVLGSPGSILGPLPLYFVTDPHILGCQLQRDLSAYTCGLPQLGFLEGTLPYCHH